MLARKLKFVKLCFNYKFLGMNVARLIYLYMYDKVNG
jgi:hypothetical protein